MTVSWTRRALLTGAGAATFSGMLRGAQTARAEEGESMPLFSPEIFGRLSTPRPIPSASIQDEAGRPITLSRWQGRPFLLHFWATWCPPCIAELPGVDAVARTADAASFAIVPVAVRGSTASKVRRFYQAHNIGSLPVYIDPISALLIETADPDALTQSSKQTDDEWSKHPVSRQGIPRTLIVNESGQIVAESLGGLRWEHDAVRDTIAALTKA